MACGSAAYPGTPASIPVYPSVLCRLLFLGELTTKPLHPTSSLLTTLSDRLDLFLCSISASRSEDVFIERWESIHLPPEHAH